MDRENFDSDVAFKLVKDYRNNKTLSEEDKGCERHTNSSLHIKPALPVVKPLVINLDEDSDSESEDSSNDSEDYSNIETVIPESIESEIAELEKKLSEMDIYTPYMFKSDTINQGPVLPPMCKSNNDIKIQEPFLPPYDRKRKSSSNLYSVDLSGSVDLSASTKYVEEIKTEEAKAKL